MSLYGQDDKCLYFGADEIVIPPTKDRLRNRGSEHDLAVVGKKLSTDAVKMVRSQLIKEMLPRIPRRRG